MVLNNPIYHNIFEYSNKKLNAALEALATNSETEITEDQNRSALILIALNLSYLNKKQYNDFIESFDKETGHFCLKDFI